MNSKTEDKFIMEGSCLLSTQILEMNGRVSKLKTRIDADLTKCQEAFSLPVMGIQTSEIFEKTGIKEKGHETLCEARQQDSCGWNLP